MKTHALALAAALALPAAPAAAQSNIDGTYVDSGGYTEITVGPCGNARCGEITRIIKRKPGEPNRDVHNDDPALRDRPILGIRILKNLTWDDGAWRGEVYNPEDGNTYRTEVRPARGGALEVKGCVTLFCRTRIWPAAD
ncbi:DUF2147 domain-containing protein [Aurantiacibacter poecillastricola]|uniref:DUF2147 domain-containing protein n=1 Tax=Aurantiacibacter poecillastricola TaxID=3064385 RepID=UPI00273E586E|nr:DUF2147 domain-containing protein [Aurantiacibacter sp. 219JJ12-13]MDP5261106.1 DUF2147 domain-containing protein [Aurantiacibacter sp. 219JJ12-13]